MKIGDISSFDGAGLAAQNGTEQVSAARDREFQKFLDKAADLSSAARKSNDKLEAEADRQLADSQPAASQPADRQLKEAANQFEALFIFQMLQRMRATVMKGGLLEESMGEQVFRGMLDQEYTMKMAEAGNLGLAEMIYEQLKQK